MFPDLLNTVTSLNNNALVFPGLHYYSWKQLSQIWRTDRSQNPGIIAAAVRL